MQYFLDTTETVPSGQGFAHFDLLHIIWLLAFVVITLINCFVYRRLSANGKNIWKKTVAGAGLSLKSIQACTANGHPF